MEQGFGTRFKEMREMENLARQRGARAAKLIPAHQVIVDERVRLKCQVPLCPEYGFNLMCPPALPPVDEFRSMLERYSWALLLQVAVPVGAEDAPAREEDGYRGQSQLHQLVNDLEGEALRRGYTLAAGLIGGTCRLCATCVGQGSAETCRHPFRARPSMEAMGIDVQDTCREAGLSLGEFPVNREVIWTGLLLLD